MQDSRVLPLAPLRHRYFSEERTLEHSVFTLALVPLHPRWTHAPYGCTLSSPKVRCPPADSAFLTFPDSHSSAVFCLCGYSSPILTRSPLGATAAHALQLQGSSPPLLSPPLHAPPAPCWPQDSSPPAECAFKAPARPHPGTAGPLGDPGVTGGGGGLGCG